MTAYWRQIIFAMLIAIDKLLRPLLQCSQMKIRTTTSSGIALAPTYSHSPQEAQHSLPGKFPYRRGIHETMYRGRLWTMRQYAGFGSAAEANERFKFLLSQGVTGLSVAFDLPTQMGLDPDAPLAKGEVGRVGVSIASVDDMEQLLEGLPLDEISLSMTINATAPILLAFVLVVAERRGISWDRLRGTVQNDILKEYIARGTYIYPPAKALRLAGDLIAFAASSVPQWNGISISGYHIREAGSTASQELSFTFLNAITYVRHLCERGIAVDDFASRLSFFFNCHSDFFEEIAKFRAGREIWATIMKERFSAQDEKSAMLRFHTQTAGSSLTAQQPLNNVVRTTLQALAAVLGGTQSLHTNSYDEALGLPTPNSASLAVRTQQIIAYESGIAAVADPLGGCFFVEQLTSQIRALAEETIARIEAQGGMLRAIEMGLPQKEIETAAYESQKRVEKGEDIIVGVNAFASSEKDSKGTLHHLDPKIEAGQVEKLRAMKAKRSSSDIALALNNVSSVAKGLDNLMPTIISAAKAGATVGEISDALKSVFGCHQPVFTL